jgi:hypothetical protein
VRENCPEIRAKRAAAERARRAGNPEKAREATQRRRCRKYGISLEDYGRLLTKQRGKCAICRTKNPAGRYGEWQIDHDHETGQVRGLLCNNCNHAIGLLKEDLEVLAAALAYVKCHRQMVLAV